MTNKTSSKKTVLRIIGTVGGVALTSGIGLPWLGAMIGGCLPDAVEDVLNFLTAGGSDKEKEKALEKILTGPLNSLVPEIAGGIIDRFYQSHQDLKESELNYDLPRAVVQVWKEGLIKMLPTKREKSLYIINRDYIREDLITFWEQKLIQTESNNDLLKELFGKTPDYFLDLSQGKQSFLEVLLNQKQVEKFFLNRLEESFTNWANRENKFPEDWQRSIRQDLKDELKQKLFHKFTESLKKALKENERAWKSFEFASSLQTVSMLQSLVSNIEQIKGNTSNTKQDLVYLRKILLLMPDIISKKFNELDKILQELFTSNHITNDLLISFRVEVNEKLDVLIYSYENLVTFQKWKEKRDKNKRQNKVKPVETLNINNFIKSFTDGIFYYPKHFILKGDISTGKSTIIRKIGEILLESDKNIKIIVLPLTREFQLEEGWERKESCLEFNKYLKQIASLKNTKAVFIVEDAHEGEGGEGHIWARDLSENFSSTLVTNKIDLSNIPIIITTRPDKFEEIKNRLKESWKIDNPIIYETIPEDIVEELIRKSLSSETVSRKLRDAWLKCGRILLIFNEILEGWMNEGKQEGKDFMSYAYRAVYEEMKRVLPEDAKDNESSRLTVMLLWMASGLEIGLEESFLSSNFRVYSENLLKHLEKSNEIHRDNQDRFISNRHPAWGLLTIKAVDVDNSRFFGAIQQDIRERFLKTLTENLSLEKEREIRRAKPSVLLMTSLLKSKIIDVHKLGFYCSGRHIHDEFVTAAGYDIDILRAKPEANEEELSLRLLAIAGNARRSNAKGRNADDPMQRQEVMNEAYERLVECIEMRKKLFGDDLENDVHKGWILYEEAYFQFLKGDFDASANGFKQSKQFEFDSGRPERQMHGAMSGVMEANCLIHEGKLNEADIILKEISEILENSSGDENELHRFKYNAYGAYVELFLAQKNSDKAIEFTEKCVHEGNKGNIDVIDQIYKARIALLSKDGQKAEEFVKEALENSSFMSKADHKITANRVLGDAFLMQNKKDEALIEYYKLLPPENSDFKYMDFDLKIIKMRLEKMKEGISIEKIFDDVPV